MCAEKPDGILKKLNDAGFEAYYVGGCVRDRLLERPIHDWDVTTSARPEQVTALFERCIPTGIRHGTVTVLLSERCRAEVTMFRADGAYLDGRHPAQVQFVPSLREDLARRDFTVNAMAMDLDGAVTDPFGGADDLRRGVLRCVGVPEQRFREDALRMLRALRFSAQLGFSLEPETARAVRRCAPLCAALSAERVRDEMEKTLCSPQPERLEEMAAIGLLRPVGIERLPELRTLGALPEEPVLRWTGLLRLCPDVDPECLRLPAKAAQQMRRAAAAARSGLDTAALKRCIADDGWQAAELAARLDGKQALLEEIRASGDCVLLRQLALTGRDFPHLHGPAVGEMLRALLEHVLAHPEDNTREALTALAARILAEKDLV